MKASVTFATWVFLTLAVETAAIACERDAIEGPADLILTNGKVFSADDTGTFHEALAICNDTIVAVGSSEQIVRWRGPDTEVIDAAGRAILPGFIDNHVHLMGGGRAADMADLRGAATLEEVQRRIRTFAAEHPDSPWVEGRAWTYSAFPDLLPTRQQLDSVVPDRPAIMRGNDGHTSWVNSKALALAGIDNQTPDPAGGTIVRDATGAPTGVLKEIPAMALVNRVLPERTADDDRRALRAAIAEAHRSGVTSITEAYGSPDGLVFLDDARRAGALALRVHYSIGVRPGFSEQDMQAMEQAWREHPDTPTLKTGIAKLLLDGVTSTHTAYMLAPYANESTTGTPFFAREELERITQILDQRGWQIMIHAIGDGAVRMALDALERVAAVNSAPERGRRHRLEHASFMHPADAPRFGELGVIVARQGSADFAPPNAPPESTPNPTVATVGVKRWAEHGGIVREVLDAGGVLTLGSDWPVALFDPMGRITGYVNRPIRPGGTDQRLPMTDAIEAYTRGSAYGSFRETQIGTLRPGMLADVVMLATDVFSEQPTKPQDVKVVMTIFDGRIVYRGDR
jgi:predicted amidohydrolase YtcJ